MRPIMWILGIILAALLIVTFVAPKFAPKKKIVAVVHVEPSSPEGEPMSVQIPPKQEYDIPGAALQKISATLDSDAIKTRLPEVDPAMLEAPLQAPTPSPEENMTEALNRAESEKFFKKIKQARDGDGKAYQIKGAVFSPEGNLPVEKEN